MIIHTKKKHSRKLIPCSLRRKKLWVSYLSINCILLSSSLDTRNFFFFFFCLSSSDFSLETRFFISPQCISPRYWVDVIKGYTIKKGLHLSHYTVAIFHSESALQNCRNVTHQCNFIVIHVSVSMCSSMVERHFSTIKFSNSKSSGDYKTAPFLKGDFSFRLPIEVHTFL